MTFQASPLSALCFNVEEASLSFPESWHVKNVTYTTAILTEVYNGLVINILVCVSFSSKSCIDHTVVPSFGYLHALPRIIKCPISVIESIPS